MDFVFDDSSQNAQKFKHEIKLLDIETKAVFYDKLTFIYLEMPKFKKKETELKTHFDKWLFLLNNLNKLDNRPSALQERVFQKAMDTAEIAQYNQQDRYAYQDSLKSYRDMKNSIDTAVKDALLEQKLEIARALKQKGVDWEAIQGATGLRLNLNKLEDINNQ
jgi:predicted transposase/invertase (TIGR01784 family)